MDGVELSDSHSQSVQHNSPFLTQLPSDEPQLPPVDGGRRAYLFLAACFLLEALIWGFNFSFGVFQEYYCRNSTFGRCDNVATIGTTATGVIYLSAPLVFGLLLSYPRLKRWACPVGLVIMCLSIGLSSFAKTTTDLILSQGVGYAIGAGLAYAPTIIFMDEWFVRRKGLAYGVMWAGTGSSGVVLPILIQWLLNSYGYRTALRIWALCLFICMAPLIYFLKPRIPTAISSRARRFDLSFLWDRTFIIYQTCNIIEALGFFLPQVYLPTYATSLGASDIRAALTIVLINVASVFGCLGMGALIDRFHVTKCIMISTLGTVTAILFLWGFSIHLGLLYCFCIMYGLFAGSFSSTWPGVIRETQKEKNSIDTGMVFSFLAAGRGIGNVVSGPLSGALINISGARFDAGYVYGSAYGPLIIFTALSAFLGGASILARVVKLV